jgi:hypothetical protein
MESSGRSWRADCIHFQAAIFEVTARTVNGWWTSAARTCSPETAASWTSDPMTRFENCIFDAD